MSRVKVADVFNQIPQKPDESVVDMQLKTELNKLEKKIIVLDDDPTGVQTVHDISVYTDWETDSIRKGFLEENSMFFILTNSRGFTEAQTIKAHKEIAERICKIAKETQKEFLVISRGDSTLRGHYPLETEVLKDTIEENSAIHYDGEILFPFFKEGGRFTVNNVHYVQYEEELVPAGETEFAKDRTFGYHSSNLAEWAEEKTNGRFKADKAVSITLEELRAVDIEKITEKLKSVEKFNKVIVNAVDYSDVKVFVIALVRAMNDGKQFLFRSAAALTKIIGGVSDQPLLTKEALLTKDNRNGGLIVIGSHVQKTTDQLQALQELEDVKFVEFKVHLVLEEDKFAEEQKRVQDEVNKSILSGKTVAVYTERERLDLGENKKEEELLLSVKISNAVTEIVKQLKTRPKFIIAKGGITSSDIGTNGLGVKQAVVAGQIAPGIPVWYTGEDSRFPRLPYIIFPGNVGTNYTLKEIVAQLK
ncbi:four-carbon acid sugar kinase family protein [Enterococcus phoeniculicola]|jgi:uncharacterized protein YgbK (DUF1537 family)|uniref:Hydroxyacid dehydrogenase n=1 Tax=Enterococcus phoeniculicola ATCC BAA-412 TaxID=1158610 RepID=R3TUK1_9ENTE|nr:four-carbon acid sugar kinase family protein [Enterococcus phoeniculicola]EOL45284.1 hypothetical protein UC3_01174 [Enterococcus phoeniculicola ATCC BAA-412]EOT74646.1 hypothetical protein I589_02246 [Enterococcus phoeniculicola ATCC BAA-412]